MRDTISLSPATAEGLGRVGLGDFNRVEPPERMAWVVLVLTKLDDAPWMFPRGKWATIQHIQQQLDECAEDAAAACKRNTR